MSKTVLSTGRLLVGSTTREKSLTHRLPRGVFARDDEGNIQVADGLTPGGHNPLKVNISGISSSRAPYIDAIYVASSGYARFRAVYFDQANRATYIKYTSLEGQEVTVNTPNINNAIVAAFNMPSDADINKPLTLVVTDLDGNPVASKTFMPSEHSSFAAYFDALAIVADLYKARKALPNDVDDMEFIEGDGLVGRERAYLKSNGEYVGFLFTELNDYSYTIPYNGRERELPKVISWAAEPGRVYYPTDLDIYSTHIDRIPLLSTLADLTDARLDVYFRDGTLDTSYDLEERLSQYEAEYITEQSTRSALVHLSDNYQFIAYLNGQFGANYDLANLVPGDMASYYRYMLNTEQEGDLVRSYVLTGGRACAGFVRADGSRYTYVFLDTAVVGEMYGTLPVVTRGLAVGYYDYAYFNNTVFRYVQYQRIDGAGGLPIVTEAVSINRNLTINGYVSDGTFLNSKALVFDDYVAAANLPSTVTVSSATVQSLVEDVSGRMKIAKVQYMKSDGKTFTLNLAVHGGKLLNLKPLTVDDISYEAALLSSNSTEPLYPAKVMTFYENKMLIYFMKDNAFELHRSFM